MESEFADRDIDKLTCHKKHRSGVPNLAMLSQNKKSVVGMQTFLVAGWLM